MIRRAAAALAIAIIAQSIFPSAAVCERLATGSEGAVSEIRDTLEIESQIVLAVVNMMNKSATSIEDFWVVHFLTANEKGDWYFLKGDCAKGSTTSSLAVVFRGTNFSTKPPESHLQSQQWIMSGSAVDSQKKQHAVFMIEADGKFLVINETSKEAISIGEDLTLTEDYRLLPE